MTGERMTAVRNDGPELAWEWVSSANPPPRRLTPYIGYREHSATPVRRVQVPHSAYTLVLSLGPAIDVGGERLTSFVAGLYDGPTTTEFTGDQHGIEIMLPPRLAYPIFGGMPLDELTNVGTPVEKLGDHLVERLAEAPDWATRFALLDDAFERILAEAPSPSTEVSWAWRQLVASGGRVRVTKLADEIGWSRRHFAARFKAQVGLTPKAAARVLRFERAARLLRGTAELADVALACGYYDQAHFNRDFRELAGVTPQVYGREVTFVQDAWPEVA